MIGSEKVHRFESAGLGIAPFRCVGHERKIFQAVPGAPIQPGTCCDYCGQGIVMVFWIRDAAGRQFKVGSECVNKTGNAGLQTIVDRVVKKARTAASHARQDQVIARGQSILATHRTIFDAKPHPNAALAGRGKTLADYADWMFRCAGRSGKVAVTRLCERVLAEASPGDHTA